MFYVNRNEKGRDITDLDLLNKFTEVEEKLVKLSELKSKDHRRDMSVRWCKGCLRGWGGEGRWYRISTQVSKDLSASKWYHVRATILNADKPWEPGCSGNKYKRLIIFRSHTYKTLFGRLSFLWPVYLKRYKKFLHYTGQHFPAWDGEQTPQLREWLSTAPWTLSAQKGRRWNLWWESIHEVPTSLWQINEATEAFFRRWRMISRRKFFWIK